MFYDGPTGAGKARPDGSIIKKRRAERRGKFLSTRRVILSYSAVTTSASGAFFFIDSMPFMQLAFDL